MSDEVDYKPKYPEATEQKLVAKYLDKRFPGFWYHCPNGGARLGARGMFLKWEGMKRGIPDVIIDVPFTKGRRYTGTALEMKPPRLKRTKKNTAIRYPSRYQRIKLMSFKWAGRYTGVCWGAQEMIKLLEHLYRGVPLPDVTGRTMKVCWTCMHEMHPKLVIKKRKHKCKRGGKCRSTIREFNNMEEVILATTPKKERQFNHDLQLEPPTPPRKPEPNPNTIMLSWDEDEGDTSLEIEESELGDWFTQTTEEDLEPTPSLEIPPWLQSK